VEWTNNEQHRHKARIEQIEFLSDEDESGLNMDCFDSRSRHVITLIPTLDLGNFLSKIFINLSFLFLVQSLSLNIKFA
jgi:hypothetical protein